MGRRPEGDNLAAKEIINDYSNQITQWFAQGEGQRACGRKIRELTGRKVTNGTMQRVWKKLGLTHQRPNVVKRMAIHEPEADYNSEQPIEELIASRVEASRRKIQKSNKHRRTLTLPAEPVGIMVFGDPHVDNDGCDWGTLYEHITLAQRTEGVLGACVGDMQDNWIGRLARIYCESSVSASDGWRLSEWMLSAMQWVAIVGGNHDAWAHGPGVDPLQWLTKKCGVTCYAQDELRMTLQWKGRPDLDPVVWVMRHDFSGRSWFHPTHGPHKEAMLDGRCHIMTAGHIHQWGVLSTEQRHGRVTHSIRVRGYKRADSYARAKGFSEQQHGEACLIIIDPEGEEPGRVSVHWDLEHGCQYLTWLRNLRKSGEDKEVEV